MSASAGRRMTITIARGVHGAPALFTIPPEREGSVRVGPKRDSQTSVTENDDDPVGVTEATARKPGGPATGRLPVIVTVMMPTTPDQAKKPSATFNDESRSRGRHPTDRQTCPTCRRDRRRHRIPRCRPGRPAAPHRHRPQDRQTPHRSRLRVFQWQPVNPMTIRRCW